MEAVLWGAPRGGPRRLLGAAPRRPPCRTLAQRLAARATAALAADFSVDLGDVLLSLALDAPHSRVGVGYNDLGCNTSVAASGRAGSGGGAARAGGDEGQGVGGARVVLRVRELALEGTSVWCSPERERPSAALWPAALDARLRLHGLCLGVAAAGGARAAAAAPPPGADGRQPPRAGEVSIVHRWSAGATLRWRAGGAVRRADVPPTKGVRAAGAACARPPGAHAAAAAPAPAAPAGGEAVAEVAASALMVAGDAAALAAVLAAAAGLARFCAFRPHRCTRPQVRLPAAVPLTLRAGGADALYIPCRPAWSLQWAWSFCNLDVTRDRRGVRVLS